MSNDSTSSSAATLSVERAEPSEFISPVRWQDKLAQLARRTLSKDLVSSVGCSFFLFGLFTVQGIVLARMLGPEGRGQYATVVFYTQTLTFIGLLGTQQAVARWAARRKKDSSALYRVCGRLGVVTGIGTLIVVAILSALALPTEKQYLAPLCLLCSLFLPIEHVRQLWLSVDHGLGKFNSYNINRIVSGVAFPLMLVLAWVGGASTLTVVCFCFVAAPLAGLVYRIATTPKQDASRGPTIKKLLKRGRSYSLAVIASDLFSRIDVFLFLWLTSFTAQGFYAAAVPAANLLLVAPITVALFAFNAGADREKKLTTNKLLKTSAAVLAVQVLAATCYAIVLAPLMQFVFGDAFRDAVPFGLALLPAYALAGCGRIGEAYLQGRNKALVGVWSRALGAITIFAFVLFAFDAYGPMSIPFGAIAGHLVSALILFIAILRDTRANGAPGSGQNAALAGGGVR